MAKLPRIDVEAMEIRSMRSEGRYDEALTRLLSHLDAGTASPEIQAIAADCLRPKPSDGKRGPKTKKPYKWLDIGREYYALIDNGVSDTEARLILSERHPREKRTIDTIIAYYNKAMDEYRRIEAEALANN
jgi:hypothetical protein